MRCSICWRNEGDAVDLSGVPDGIPLGPVEACPTCGRPACPDCLHEADCCFVEADDHNDDPSWAPDGWRRTNEPTTNGAIEYVRIHHEA